jgi:hypothetical protein
VVAHRYHDEDVTDRVLTQPFDNATDPPTLMKTKLVLETKGKAVNTAKWCGRSAADAAAGASAATADRIAKAR